MTGNGWRISGMAGVLFVVTFIVGVLVQGDVPDYKASGEKIVAWYADNSDQFLIGDFITGLGFILFYFPFLAGLYARLRGAEGEPPMLARSALMGGILFPVAGLAGGIIQAGLALLKADASPEVALFASAAASHAFVAVSGVTALMMWSAAAVILTRGGFAKWMGWLGLAGAALGIIGAAASIEGDPDGVISLVSFISIIVFAVWLLSASVSLWRQESPTATMAAAPA